MRNPSRVLSAITSNTAMLTSSRIENSPVPNHKAISGIRPIVGTWRMALNNGPSTMSTGRIIAIAVPSRMPARAPQASPVSAVPKVARTWRLNSPLAHNSAKLRPISGSGTNA